MDVGRTLLDGVLEDHVREPDYGPFVCALSHREKRLQSGFFLLLEDGDASVGFRLDPLQKIRHRPVGGVMSLDELGDGIRGSNTENHRPTRGEAHLLLCLDVDGTGRGNNQTAIPFQQWEDIELPGHRTGKKLRGDGVRTRQIRYLQPEKGGDGFGELPPIDIERTLRNRPRLLNWRAPRYFKRIGPGQIRRPCRHNDPMREVAHATSPA